MTADHINKYLFNATIPGLFEAGRLCLPIFVFVLAYNLARPGTLLRGAYERTMRRLAGFGTLASIPYIALGGLVANWWPLNIMFTLLVITAVLYLLERGGTGNILWAISLFILGGSSVEYWWPAIILGIGVWSFCKHPTVPSLMVALAACASLWLINKNFWALGAFPVILAVQRLRVSIPRLRWAFYAYYPLHLAALWLIRIPMRKAGYLFF